KAMLVQSHREMMALAETFTDRELFEKGVYPWTGNSTLGSYFAANMSSHYDWAIKKLKAHRKNCKE
ncbi:MAG: ClbS/DfsB family four-helix bundle protein, partial [Acetatifactor sp.]|nr:ClbS/DfsB family four-helix bundle protein [Acetatifactor sp.]